MSKTITYRALTVAGFMALGLGIWQTIQHWDWLDARHLSGMAILDLIGLGFLAFVIPIHLRGMVDTATSGEMARDVLVRGGLAMLALTAIGGGFVLIGFLLSIPGRWGRPYLLLPALLVLLPIGLALLDILRGIVQRTPANLIWSWLHHSFELYYLLLIQVGIIPVAFLLFPAGIFLQLISIIDGGIRIFGSSATDSLPLLCQWASVSETACPPALVTFHIGHLALAILGLQFGELALEEATDWYVAGMDWLGERIEY